MRSYGTEQFFSERIASQAQSAAVSHRQVAFFPPVARILTDQGAVLLFLCVVIAVQLRHGDVRQLLSLLIFEFVLSRRLRSLISQISFMAGQMENSYKNVELIAHELKECSLWTAVTPRTQKMKGSFVADLQHVSFAFHEGSPLLRNISLCLRQGERVLLCGASGSGCGAAPRACAPAALCWSRNSLPLLSCHRHSGAAIVNRRRLRHRPRALGAIIRPCRMS